MIVVADTTPLNYLVLIDSVQVLPLLFGRVCIPQEVEEELARASAPPAVRRWISAPPAWLEVIPISAQPGSPSLAFPGLDAGESAALRLALSLKPDFLLIDEREGTRAARELGLQTTGTLGVLEMAAMRELIDLGVMIGPDGTA